MTIATRTTGGEPIRCGICGREDFVLVSLVTRDSVCPSCGSHVWVLKLNTFKTILTKEVIESIPGLVNRLQHAATRQTASNTLVDGLFFILLPLGVTLWLPAPNSTIRLRVFERISTRGEDTEPTVAAEVTNQRTDVTMNTETQSGKRLVIGVPMFFGHSRVGAVLQIVQDSKLKTDLIDEYIRFTHSMAAVAAGCLGFAR